MIDYFIDNECWDEYFEISNSWNITKEGRKQNFKDIFNVLTKAFKLTARDVIHICQDINMVFKSHDPFSVSPVYILLVYVIENYQYKIKDELEAYQEKHNFNLIESLIHYCTAQKYELANYKKQVVTYQLNSGKNSSIDFSSNLANFISFLDYKGNTSAPENKCEKFYALSRKDYFMENGAYDVYTKTKAIIMDVIALDDNRKTELEKEKEIISKQKMQTQFYYGDGLVK